jgi:hypothetical protein
MRIEVVGGRAISRQARTYAEYRLFAALTQLSQADKVRQVRAVLREVQLGADCTGVACTVTVKLAGSDPIWIRAIGPHAYAAINHAVERLRIHGDTRTEDRVST